MTPRTPTRSFRPSGTCGRRRVRQTCSSSSSMMWALAPPACSAGRVTRPTSRGSRRPGCATRASTRRPFAHRRGKLCSPAAITTRPAWAASPRLRLPRRATARFCPTPRRRSRSPSSSMGTRRLSSASATRFRCGRRVRRGRSLRGQPEAADSNTSTASSAARTISLTPPSTKARRQSSHPRRRPRAITSPRTSPTRRSPGPASKRR